MYLVVISMEMIEVLKAYETLKSHDLAVQLSNLGTQKNNSLSDENNSIEKLVEAKQPIYGMI